MKHNVISVLCNPVRLKLICCLSKKSKNVQELVSTCGLSQSAISQHLTKLKEAGLVKDKKEGLFIYYSLTYPKSAKIAQLITNFSKEVIK
jgi:ArsR family transcriptional regulator, virulence genes transcriptional regulator